VRLILALLPARTPAHVAPPRPHNGRPFLPGASSHLSHSRRLAPAAALGLPLRGRRAPRGEGIRYGANAAGLTPQRMHSRAQSGQPEYCSSRNVNSSPHGSKHAHLCMRSSGTHACTRALASSGYRHPHHRSALSRPGPALAIPIGTLCVRHLLARSALHRKLPPPGAGAPQCSLTELNAHRSRHGHMRARQMAALSRRQRVLPRSRTCSLWPHSPHVPLAGY
jgi:hypothetical protein